MNLFDLVNEELKRMTAERDFWLKVALESPVIKDKYGGTENHPNVKVAMDKYREIGMDILEVRKRIFGQIEDYDKRIQEKIAELALTGAADV